jgi:hypothetical protein
MRHVPDHVFFRVYRLFYDVTHDHAVVRNIFAAFWGGMNEHRLASFLYFPRWLKDEKLLKTLLANAPGNDVSKWSLDTAVRVAQLSAVQNPSYIIPFSSVLAKAPSLIDDYTLPSLGPKTLEAPPSEYEGAPYHALWTFSRWFYKNYGAAMSFDHVLYAFEYLFLHGEVDAVEALRTYMQPAFEHKVRRKVREFYQQAAENRSRALIYVCYPEAVDGLTPPPGVRPRHPLSNIL